MLVVVSIDQKEHVLGLGEWVSGQIRGVVEVADRVRGAHLPAQRVTFLGGNRSPHHRCFPVPGVFNRPVVPEGPKKPRYWFILGIYHQTHYLRTVKPKQQARKQSTTKLHRSKVV